MFDDKLDLLGVFDGHNGADVAQFSAVQLPRLIERNLKKYDNDVPKALMSVWISIILEISSYLVLGVSFSQPTD